MSAEKESKSVQIVGIHENKLNFSEETFQKILDKVGNRAVSIISINGPKNAVKSIILTQFLKYISNYNERNWQNISNDNNYEWKLSDEPEKAKISIWSDPVLVKKNGEEVAVLLMNTEGSFDQNSSQEEMLVLTLSFILSSTLILTLSEDITDNITEFINLFIGYAKGTTDPNSMCSFTQMVLMINGWQFPKRYSFGYHDTAVWSGTRSYRTDRLNVSKMIDEIQPIYNHTVEGFFKVSFCLLPELSLRENSKSSAEFLKVISDMTPKILHPSCIRVKTITDHKFSGQTLIKFVDNLGLIFRNNRNQLNPTEYSSQVQTLIAYNSGFISYIYSMDRILKKKDFYDEDDLKSLHDVKAEHSMALFLSNCSEKTEFNAKYELSLKDLFRNGIEFYLKENERRKNSCSNGLNGNKLSEEMKNSKNPFINSYKDLNESISQVIGIDLDKVSNAVQSAFGGVSDNGRES